MYFSIFSKILSNISKFKIAFFLAVLQAALNFSVSFTDPIVCKTFGKLDLSWCLNDGVSKKIPSLFLDEIFSFLIRCLDKADSAANALIILAPSFCCWSVRFELFIYFIKIFKKSVSNMLLSIFSDLELFVPFRLALYLN